MARSPLTPSPTLPLRGRVRRQGQALIETALMLPLFAVAFWGFGLLHERALDDFDSTRTLRILLTFMDEGANPRSAFPSAKLPRVSSLRVDAASEGMTRMAGKMAEEAGMGAPPSLVSVRRASFTVNRPGLWQERSFEGVILAPGAFRRQAALWMTLAAFAGVATP